MITKFRYIILINLIISSFYCYSLDISLNNKQLNNEIETLIKQKNFTKIISKLNKSEPNIRDKKMLGKIWLKKAYIYINFLDKFETGINYIDKAKNLNIFELKEIIKKLKNLYSLKVTKKKLELINFYIEKYFIENIKFLKNLKSLINHYKILSKNSIKDIFGNIFQYELVDNKVYKGDDKLSYKLYSLGKDGKKHTKDDIKFNYKEYLDVKDIKLINVFKKDELFYADILFYNSQFDSIINKTVIQGENLEDFTIFGINEKGIILLKNKQIIVKNLNKIN